MPQIKTELTPEQYALLYAALTALETTNRAAYNLAVMEGHFETADGLQGVGKDLIATRLKIFSPSPSFDGGAHLFDFGRFLEYFLNATPRQRQQLANEQ